MDSEMNSNTIAVRFVRFACCCTAWERWKTCIGIPTTEDISHPKARCLLRFPSCKFHLTEKLWYDDCDASAILEHLFTFRWTIFGCFSLVPNLPTMTIGSLIALCSSNLAIFVEFVCWIWWKYLFTMWEFLSCLLVVWWWLLGYCCPI